MYNGKGSCRSICKRENKGSMTISENGLGEEKNNKTKSVGFCLPDTRQASFSVGQCNRKEGAKEK